MGERHRQWERGKADREELAMARRAPLGGLISREKKRLVARAVSAGKPVIESSC